MFDKEVKCKSCSKEIVDRVPIIRVISKLDECFSRNDLSGAKALLEHWESEARHMDDTRGLLEILNEEIGFYRRTNDSEKGLSTVNEALDILEHLSENISIGTIYINCATTMKAFGLAKDSIAYYEKAKSIYEKYGADSFNLAALYNNMASAFAELNEFSKAENSYRKAIEILTQDVTNFGEIAVSYVNLAHLYYDRDPFDDRAYSSMDTAWEYLMNKENRHDGNYAFVCSKCAPSFAFFGYFLQEKELIKISEEIYERS